MGTCQGEIFDGIKSSVTLTTSIFNNTRFRVVYRGSYIKRGYKIGSECDQSVNGYDNSIIWAVCNGDYANFTNLLRGTSGVALWYVNETGYFIVMGWRIPKYRKLLQQSNTLAIGLLMDNGHFSKANRSLYKSLMVSMKPGTFENHGNFVRIACSALSSGYSNAVTLENNKLKLVANITTGRKAKCQLLLTGLPFCCVFGDNSSTLHHWKPTTEICLKSVTIKLVAFRRCICELEEDSDERPFRIYPGQYLDDVRGYVVGLLFQSESEKSGVFCTAKLKRHYMFNKQFVIGDGTKLNYSLANEVSHRRMDNCFGDHINIKLRAFKIGEMKMNILDLLYCAQELIICNDQPYRRHDSRDWILHLSRLLGLDRAYPNLTTLLKADIKRLVNHDVFPVQYNEYYDHWNRRFKEPPRNRRLESVMKNSCLVLEKK